MKRKKWPGRHIRLSRRQCARRFARQWTSKGKVARWEDSREAYNNPTLGEELSHENASLVPYLRHREALLAVPSRLYVDPPLLLNSPVLRSKHLQASPEIPLPPHRHWSKLSNSPAYSIISYYGFYHHKMRFSFLAAFFALLICYNLCSAAKVSTRSTKQDKSVPNHLANHPQDATRPTCSQSSRRARPHRAGSRLGTQPKYPWPTPASATATSNRKTSWRTSAPSTTSNDLTGCDYQRHGRSDCRVGDVCI